MLSLVCVLIHSLDQPLQRVNRFSYHGKVVRDFRNFRIAQTFGKLQNYWGSGPFITDRGGVAHGVIHRSRGQIMEGWPGSRARWRS